VQGRIPGTTDYGFTEALGNLFQPGVKNPGFAQAFKNFHNDANDQEYNKLPVRPAGMDTAQSTGGHDRRPPITSPNTTFQHADDEYNRLISQYGGAPGISQLAGMASLPTGFTPTGATKQANLKDYYAAQTLQGNANLGTIIKDMGYSGKMAEWAQLHPGLAQEQYAKKFGAGSAGGRDIGSFIGDVTRYADQGQASPAGQSSFSNVANAVPAPPQQQGAAVSAPYAQANAQAAEKTAGATGMPNLETTAKPQTTLDKVSGFLNGITPVIKAVFPAGAGQIFGPNY
jgi:hypothetical protein